MEIKVLVEMRQQYWLCLSIAALTGMENHNLIQFGLKLFAGLVHGFSR